MSKKIRKGDTVIVLAGNERGRIGKVMSREGDKAVIQGLNLRKKTVKKSEENPNGGIVELEKPIHISNLRICIDEGQPIKLRAQFNDDGQKEYYYKVGGENIVYRSSKKER